MIDQVVKEPRGGAHRDAEFAVKSVGTEIVKALKALSKLDADTLIKQRREKFLDIGRSLL